MIRFKHVYVIQKKEEEGSAIYVATFPALLNVGGLSDTQDGAIDALRSVLVNLLRDIEKGDFES